MESIFTAATFGLVLAAVLAALRIIEALVRKRNGGGDDRGKIVETMQTEARATRALIHDIINELRAMHESADRQEHSLSAVREDLRRLEQNQAVILDRQKHNGAA